MSSPEFLVPVCVMPDNQSELTWKCGELKGGAPPESNNKCNYNRSDSKSDNEPLLSHSSCEKCTNVITLSFPANTIPKRFHYDISSDGAVTISFLDIMSFLSDYMQWNRFIPDGEESLRMGHYWVKMSSSEVKCMSPIMKK